jgi:ribosomal protein L14
MRPRRVRWERNAAVVQTSNEEAMTFDMFSTIRRSARALRHQVVQDADREGEDEGYWR